MTQELEWGGARQLMLLLHSGSFGVVLGLLFDGMTGLWRGARRRKRFFVDVLFCVLTAVLTFFCSLVLTDGRLHPVLFAGLVAGLLAEHLSVGRWVSRWIYKLVRLTRSLSGHLCAFLGRLDGRIRRAVSGLVALTGKRRKKVEKIRKKRRFFQKKS